jgi:hypothetical protein
MVSVNFIRCKNSFFGEIQPYKKDLHPQLLSIFADCYAKMSGDFVWGRCLGTMPGDDAWGRCLGTMPGDDAPRYDVSGLQPGDVMHGVIMHEVIMHEGMMHGV